MAEELERGNRALAKFCGWSLRTMHRNHLKEMKRNGVVMERYEGRERRKVNVWFPSVVQRYLIEMERIKKNASS